MVENSSINSGFFKSGFDFKTVRTPLAAFGFYVFHLVAGFILAVVVSVAALVVLGLPDQGTRNRIVHEWSAAVGFVYAVGLFAAILRVRKLWKDPWYLGGLAVTVLIAGYSGILGLIPSGIIIALKPKETP